jgi:hypothetical protein
MDTSHTKEVGKVHAKVYRRESADQAQWMIEDNNSKNGTFINSCKIRRRYVHDGDEVVFGGGPKFQVGDYVVSTDMAECRYLFFQLPPKVVLGPEIDLNATLLHSGLELCAICYCPIAGPETLPCGHQFCFTCIREWSLACQKAQRHWVCPLCRRPFTASQLAKEEGCITNGVANVHLLEPLLRQLDVTSCSALPNVFQRWNEKTKKWFWNALSTVKSGPEFRQATFLYLVKATYKDVLAATPVQLRNALKNLGGTIREGKDALTVDVLLILLKKIFKGQVSTVAPPASK